MVKNGYTVFSAPCAHVPRYHTLEECVEDKLPFCQIVRAIVDDKSRSLGQCNLLLAETALNEKKFAMLDADEVLVIKMFQKRVVSGAASNVISFVTSDMIVLLGTLPKLQEALSASWIVYNPDQNFNGKDPITVQLNDLGNEGMRYPCPTPPDLPEKLHLEHCMKTRPYVAHITQKRLPITVLQVNDKPYLVMFDEFGNDLEELLVVEAVQNISRFLPPLRIQDVDLEETLDAELQVDLSVKGGSLSYDFSVPYVQAFLSPGGARLQVIGTLANVNTLLLTIQYQSDPQMIGSDVILVEIDDEGQTGVLNEADLPGKVAFYVAILVTKPLQCEFETCTECVENILEDCGWCPDSCGGRGKCRPSVPDRSAPLFGICGTLSTELGSLEWNQCRFPRDNSWIKGAIGSPLLFVFILCAHVLFAWSRKMHGSIPIYTKRFADVIVLHARRLYLLPPADASNIQILYVGIFILLGLFLPGTIQKLVTDPPVRMELGEATYFALNTDGCEIFIKKKANNYYGNEQPTATQDIKVNNLGYDLDARIIIEQDLPLACHIISLFGTLGVGD